MVEVSNMANINISRILMKRGNTAAASTYTGPLGELLVDTGLQTIRIQDGVTAGGMATLATYSQIQTLTNSISTITGIDATFVANINTLLANAAIQDTHLSSLDTLVGNNTSYIDSIIGGEVQFRDLIPQANLAYNLGSPTYQWGNLYVGSDTIYIAGVALRVDQNGNLTINGNSIGGGSAANTGNIGFTGDAIYDLNGIIIENANLSTAATAAVIVPANGTSDPLQLNNSYGPVNITSGTDSGHLKTWAFGTDGNLTLPSSGKIVSPDGITMITNRGSVRFGADIELPGLASHFHIAPTDYGNTVDLFFGDDGNYVKLPNLDNGLGVEIGAGASEIWRFGTDGNITLPNANNPAINYYGNNRNILSTVVSVGNTAPSSTDRDVWYSTEDGRLYIYNESTWVDASPTVVPAPNTYLGNLSIADRTIYSDLAGWTFGTDGTLTTPGNVYVTGNLIIQGNTYQEDREIFVSAAGEAVEFANGGNIFAPAGLGNVIVSTNHSQYNWTFGTDGELYLPSNGRLGFAGKGWTGLDGGPGNPTSLTSLYSSGMYSSCITLSPDGTLAISTYGDGTGQLGSWNFSGANLALPGGLTFPDATVQSTAFALQGLAPNTPWGNYYPAGGGVANIDYAFYFDGTTGYPSMVSYAAAGGNPVYTSTWGYEYNISGTPGYGSTGNSTPPVNNTVPVAIFNAALGPGDWATLRVQCLDTNRIYRVTFLGSYNVLDAGNEAKYGSITVERLL